MPRYCHDYMHCSQSECKKKDACYRYWLGQELKNSGHLYASFFMPTNKEDIDNCRYYEPLNEH